MAKSLIVICLSCPFSQSNQAGCAGACACTVDGRDIKEHVAQGDCGKGFFADGALPPPWALDEKPPPASVTTTWGPEMWAQLHTAKSADEAWLMAWSTRVPCGPCAIHWMAVLREMPPIYGDGWFEWTWRAHNAVNAKLDKPVVALTDARSRWHPSP